jgi:dolichol-phosphate mannosyltransferase
MERLTLPIQSRIHSRSGRHVAFLISKTRLPAATINMITQMLVPPPKYYVNKLLPDVRSTQQACLAGMFIIERGECEIRPMDNRAALEILFQNCEDAYGFPPYDEVKEFLYCIDEEDLHGKEQAIIRQAMEMLPARRIRSDNMDWWLQIPTFVNDGHDSVDIEQSRQFEEATSSRLSE